MVEAIGLSQAEAGIIASANFLGYLLGALAAAKAVLPGGRRRWFLVALASSALTPAAKPGEASLPLFILLPFASGVVPASVTGLFSALVLHLRPPAAPPPPRA